MLPDCCVGDDAMVDAGNGKCQMMHESFSYRPAMETVILAARAAAVPRLLILPNLIL